MTTDRKCGDCGACCDVLGVPGLKEPRTRCPHMKSCGTNRCTIHASPEKPSDCSTYSCMWLAGHLLTGDRPDRIGMIFDGARDQDGHYIVTAREVRPDSSRSGRAAQLVDQMAAGMVVIVVPHDNGNRRIVCKNPQIIAKLRPRLANLGLHV